MIAFHQSGYRDFKTYYIHFVYHYLTNEFSELVTYTRMFKLMQGLQGLPSLIHPSYRFVTTYAFSE
ncbi:Mobile element protein [Candidatus Enterovibrio escicola]|uniref:Mobile element protein n=1 Tax=Candidatus Enterovibrio escicola TaxID=1927127 RepID=A0A2A5T1N3_9GAMM|nr:Mobile element protein [Candidatus Enterovibrio escacola]